MNTLRQGRPKIVGAVVLFATTIGGIGVEPLLASPARRLARRGVVVVPPATAVLVPTPLVVPPVPVPPPGWPLRRPLLPPFAPPFPFPPVAAVVAVRPVPARPAVVTVVPAPATQAPASPSAAPVPVTPPVPAAAEEIPPPPAAAAATAKPADEDTAFTEAWFARHPEAWQPGEPADWWQVADLATVAGWLDGPAADARQGNPATADGAAPANGRDVGSDGLRSVLVLPAEADGRGVPQGNGGWLPLGVFAVVPPGDRATGSASHTMQQLAVDREGTIRGNFVDALSGTVHPITGSIDRGTLTATWTVGAAGGRFTAPIASFTAEPRTVTVTVGGVTHAMALSRLSRP